MINTSQVWIIKFFDENERELPGLRNVRLAAPQQIIAEAKADELLNTWLVRNPGRTGSWSITTYVQPKAQMEALADATLAGYAARIRGEV